MNKNEKRGKEKKNKIFQLFSFVFPCIVVRILKEEIAMREKGGGGLLTEQANARMSKKSQKEDGRRSH